MVNVVVLMGTLGLAGAYFYAIFATVHVRTFGDPVGPRLFPILLGCALLLSAAMLVYEKRAAKTQPPAAVPQAAPESGRARSVIAAIALLTLAYFLTFEWAGYVLSTAVYLTILTSYFHKGRHLINIATAIIFSLGSYLLFTRALQVSLPAGVLPL